MQDRMEESRRKEIENNALERLSRENGLQNYREVIEQQERELNTYSVRLKEEQLKREKEFQKELDAREKFFSEREKKLFMRQRDFDANLTKRQEEIESLRKHLQIEISSREEKLQQAAIELQQEKERYSEQSRKKIEQTSKDYVVDTLETLGVKEKQFHRIAKIWSLVGAGSLGVGIVFFAYVSVSSAITLPAQISWEFIAFIVFKGLIAVALLAGLSKYSFLFSSSYMQESLKNADRRHAINFGKFYLESYGAAADWTQVKEAFKHWNIAGVNAFTRPDSSITDVTTIEKAVAIIERFGKAIPKEKDDA